METWLEDEEDFTECLELEEYDDWIDDIFIPYYLMPDVTNSEAVA